MCKYYHRSDADSSACLRAGTSRTSRFAVGVKPGPGKDGDEKRRGVTWSAPLLWIVSAAMFLRTLWLSSLLRRNAGTSTSQAVLVECRFIRRVIFLSSRFKASDVF